MDPVQPSNREYAAQLHDGAGPAAREASVRLTEGGVSVRAPGEGATLWPFADLTLVRGQARGEPVQLEWRSTPVQVVIVAEPAFRDALLAAIPRRARLRGMGGVRIGVSTVLVALALLVAGGVAAWRFGVPALADMLADRVPREWEREFGEQVIADFVPPGKRVEDPVVAGPARRLYERLRAAGATGGEPTHLVVARDDMVNAFAAPGGGVVVTTGLLRALRSPDELAAVLAHEAGHVRRRHALRGLLRMASLQLLLAIVAGDQSALSTGLRAAGQLSGLSHSRSHEREADLDALSSLVRAELPPGALAGALESIRGASPDGPELGFLSTHPSTPDRVARIQSALEKLPRGDVRAAVTLEEWQAMGAALPPPERGAKAP